MKDIFFRTLLFGFLLLVSTSSLPAQRSREQLPPSMKGYELYSWQSARKWYFSLLVGTNRQKLRKEVTSARTRIKGISALKRQLGRLPKGQEVVWNPRFALGKTASDSAIGEEIKEFCRRRGIVLILSGSLPG